MSGGEEIQVVDSPAAGYWGYWAVVSKGIYFLDFLTRNVTPLNVAPAAVKFLNFATGSISTLATLGKLRTVLYPGLAVSPDCRWILYPQLDQSRSNVMLVENFL